MIRSIYAVMAGYCTLALLIGVTTFLTGPDGQQTTAQMTPLPSNGWILMNLFYSVLFAVAGGYVTARIARGSEIKHTLALGMVMVVFAAVVMMVSMGSLPVWYQVSLMVLAVPTALLGGYLRLYQLRRVGAAA